MAHYWDSLYSGLVMSGVADTLWEQIRPLYELLHTYVKHRLREYYADDSLLPVTEHIPEHLVGIPDSSGWLDIYDKVNTFTDFVDINLTKHLHQKMKDVRNIAVKMEEIFVGFGLNISSEASCDSSLLFKQEATNMSCVPRTIKSDVNFLFWMALRFLPRFANKYAAGKWKTAVYSRWVNEIAYNSHWWQLRCRFEGIIPPSIRQNDNFDSGVYIDAWKLSPFYRNMMNLGSSHPWEIMTGEDEIRAQPMLSIKLWLQGKLSRIDDIQLANLESNSKS